MGPNWSHYISHGRKAGWCGGQGGGGESEQSEGSAERSSTHGGDGVNDIEARQVRRRAVGDTGDGRGSAHAVRGNTMSEQQTGRRLEVVELGTNRVVHVVAVRADATERHIEQAMAGMLAHLNLHRYYVREVAS